MALLPDNSIDSIVSDFPYFIGFMGRKWDSTHGGRAFFNRMAAEAMRVLKPGGYLLGFGHPKTDHWLKGALEVAGFEIRDVIHWLYYNGNPASVDVSKVMDAAHGMERPVLGLSALHSRGRSVCPPKRPHAGGDVGMGPTEGLQVTGPASDDAKRWDQYGTGLSPAIEPIVMARKPCESSPPWPQDSRTPAGWRTAANVLKWGTGAIDIKGCRIPWTGPSSAPWPGPKRSAADIRKICRPNTNGAKYNAIVKNGPGCEAPQVNVDPGGRWPANVYYSKKPSRREKEAGCDRLPARSGADVVGRKEGSTGINNPRAGAGRTAGEIRNTHVTVKPIELMRWLVRLVTPPDGRVLDPCVGSGTTICAALMEGRRSLGIELREEAYAIACARAAHWAEEAEAEAWTSKYGTLPLED